MDSKSSPLLLAAAPALTPLPPLSASAAEVNPNLYKAAAAVLPSCTSDLWVGNATASLGGAAWTFGGDAILRALLQQLLQGLPGQPSLADADRVIILGGAGILARIDELADLLLEGKRARSGNTSATVEVYGVCDGCLMLDVQPVLVPPACSTDADCPPLAALPALEHLARIVRPAWCTDAETWRCYTAPLLLQSFKAAATPVLVVAEQYDATALASYGAPWPATGAAQAWADGEYAPAARAAAAAAPYAFSGACASPSGLLLSSAFYHTLVRHTDAYGNVHNDSASVAVPEFIEAVERGLGPAALGAFLDSCPTYPGCNPSGCSGRAV
jgi:hypothetical protein